QGIFPWSGSGQIFPSGRDMARFLAANRGTLTDQRDLQAAMALAQQGVFKVNERFTQALAWQRVVNGDRLIVDKNGGLNITSTYIGMISDARLGVVLLSNFGGGPPTPLRRQDFLPPPRPGAPPRQPAAVGGLV